MDSRSASAHLEVIRTLMERTALYRRALVPTTLAIGLLGILAGAAGWWLRWDTGRGFAWGWMAVAATGLGVALLLMRRQALRDRETFWSSPARRVAAALLPNFAAGLGAGVVAGTPVWPWPDTLGWLPPLWMVLYGAGLHAAGFFMPRGIRLFGWIFILAGFICAACGIGWPPDPGKADHPEANLIMGGVFGGLHLLYGIYLWRTGPASSTP